MNIHEALQIIAANCCSLLLAEIKNEGGTQYQWAVDIYSTRAENAGGPSDLETILIKFAEEVQRGDD